MSVRFDLGDLESGLSTFDRRFEPMIDAVISRQAIVAQGWMKDNARWNDRTGNARAGLRAIPGRDDSSWVIDLVHSMAYGIWLEVRFSGRYAIIAPALQTQGAALMRNIEGLLDRMGR